MNCLWEYFVFFLLARASADVQKLVLRELAVPALVDFRENVTLSCRFDLGGDRLYSVKWYKDEFEFYRFMPDNLPPCQSLPVPGITLLNDSRCNMENVTLTKLTFNTSGMFRCEVSTEAPNFQTVFRNSNMTVIALPAEDPMIEGVLTTYSIGDGVRALCTSDKSRPEAVLTWFINRVKVDSWMLDHSAAIILEDTQGLRKRTLGLNFVVEKKFFKGEDRQMEIRCNATVANYTKSRSVTSTLTTLTNLKLAQERLSNSACSSVSSSCTVLAILLSTLQLTFPS